MARFRRELRPRHVAATVALAVLTIGVTLTAGLSAASAATPDAERSPSVVVPGWHQVFVDNFNTDAARGDFLAVYGRKWTAYPTTFRDTSGAGTYNPYYLSVDNGVLDIHLSTVNGRAQVNAPEPIRGIGGRFGSYSVRFRATGGEGYKTAWLLWPDSNDWTEGEIDFPEGGLSGTIHAFNHDTFGNPSENALARDTGVSYDDWHIATTVWNPWGVSFYLDGSLVGTSDQSPSTSMHIVLQTETDGGAPPPSSVGDVFVDWISVWQHD